MGWNAGYTIFESTVVGAYDLGVLDEQLLKVLMEPYRGTDIDSGGSHGLRSSDGKDVEQIVIETMGGKMPARPKLPKDYRKWTEEQRGANDAYQEAVWDEFHKIAKRFGWR